MLLASLLLCCCCVLAGQLKVTGQVGSPWSTGNNDYYYDPLNPEDTLPVITTTNSSLVAIQGDSLLLPCEVHNLGEYSLTWRYKNEILWVLHQDADGLDVQCVSQDDRIGFNGTSLTLGPVEPRDSGTYICELGTVPIRALIHTLAVRVPPSVYPANNRSVVTIKMGGSITLACHATGHPKPTVTWSRKGGNLPGPAEGATLSVEDAVPEDNGIYKCTARNGVGEPASTSITLQVMHEPKVWAERDEVYSGVAYDSSLACYVEAEPRAQVKWYKVGDIPVDPLRLRKTVDANYRYSLHFDHVQLDDFGNYTCNATNFMGNSSALLRLSGRPKPVRYTSSNQGDKNTSYVLTWYVESYAPVLAYSIYYRNESDTEDQWVSFTVPGTTSSSIHHSNSHTFTELDPGATYYVQVTAKNEFGVSDINDTFTFTTFDAAATDFPEDYHVEGENSPSINQSEDMVSEVVGVVEFHSAPTSTMDDADSPEFPSEMVANQTEEKEVERKVLAAATAAVQDDTSGAFTFTLAPAERRAQMIALITAISLSCFFS
nr:protein amalgam-like isoform X1 [Procambarus clarkii]